MGLYQKVHMSIRAHRYLWKGEPDECRFVCDCLMPGAVAVDVGAHKGAFTYWMSSKVGREGHVYAYEPQPTMSDYLTSYASGCRYRNVTVAPVALSDKRGRANLVIPSGSTCWAHLQSSNHSDSGQVIDVPLETLDAHLQSLNVRRPVEFIKCDVELHELPVLRGALEILQRDRPLLLVESHHLLRQPAAGNTTFLFLQELGYVGHLFYNRALVPLDEYSIAMKLREDQSVQNFVFLHPESIALISAKPPYAVKRLVSHGSAAEGLRRVA
ncbi:MAG: FkbM family methyltransferase [Pirellulaceae bacterium]|jgi:FkbM family methyltransferase|nr:FkbM family methyltransferase [Pirellulaceae bacterium]HJN09845.1 FkbM family methyltransferase [Pirellulaceae bacterium]